MIRLLSVRFAGWLLLSTCSITTSWAQTRPKAAATPEAASIDGTIIDAVTNQPIAGATIQAKNQGGSIRSQQRVGPDGAYHLSLDDAKQAYQIQASATGYEPHEERVAFTTSYSTQLYKKAIRLYRAGTKPAPAPLHQANVDLVKAPASPGQSVSTGAASTGAVALPEATVSTKPTTPASATSTSRLTPPKTLDFKVVNTPAPLAVAPAGKVTQLRAIQFVQSKADLLPDAQPALEQLLAFMRTNATAEILLAGHTDNQGNFDENLKLSQQRVDIVKTYLVQNGIAANRITARGYGPTRPIASNNYENTRQQNRRVELIVLKL